MFASARGTCLPVALLSLLSACGGGESTPIPVNGAPTAAAGTDQTVNKRAVVTLNGTASTDPDGNALVYRWVQVSGPIVSLNSISSASPVFTAPGQSAVLVFSLTVNDGKTDSVADTVQVSVTNRAPMANAGPDVSVGTNVLQTLNGTSSSDPDSDALSLELVQISGPPVALTLVAPGLWRFTTPGVNTLLEFALTADDGESRSAPDTVVVNVQGGLSNNTPQAETSGDFTTSRRTAVQLHGSGYDPDGSPVTFAWQQISGTPVNLSGGNTPSPTFVSPATAGKLEFELRVSDGELTSVPARIAVTVENFAPILESAGITPIGPRTADTLAIVVNTDDPDSDPVTLGYVWRRNGIVVPSQTGSTFPPSLTTRGDVIALNVTASDGSASTSMDFSVAIEDTPPVITASAPTSANYGDNIAFSVSASDADGDPIGPYIVRHGPSGLDVTGAGLVTWLAVGPMFDRVVDFNWQIGLRDHPGASLGGSIRITDAARQLPLTRSGIVVPQQREQLLVADLDGDGVAEILTSNSQLLAAMNKSGANWAQSWVSPYQLSPTTESSIDSLAVADVTGDASKEIFVATGGRILQLSGADRSVRRQFVLGGPETHCGALRVADLDGNGARELVCRRADYGSNGSTILVLNAAELTLDWSVPVSLYGTSLAVGNVDADPALEIVLGEGYVFDGATHANEWLYGPGFGTTVEIGDFDGNGIGEIAAISGWSLVKVFSGVTRSPMLELDPASSGGISDIRTADLNGNGTAELIVGDAQWGNVKVFAFNSATQTFGLSASMNSQAHGVSAMAVGNVDTDPAPEIVWGTGVSDSGQDVLVVAEFPGSALSLDWSSAVAGQIDGPYVGGFLAQIAPSSRRLMFLTPRSLSGYGGSRLLTLDPATGSVAQSGEIASNWGGYGALDVADYDGDGVDEGFLTTSNLYDGFLATYDFAASALQWQSPLGYAQGIAVAHADITGDGAADFAVMGADGKISVVDPLHSISVWQSTTLGGGGVDISVADLNQDGRPEIIGLTGNYLYVYANASMGAAFTESGNAPVSDAVDLLVADIEGDSRPEILVLAGNSLGFGREVRIYGPNLQLLRTLDLQAPASVIAAEPGTGSHRNILIGSGAATYYYSDPPNTEVRAIDSVSGDLVWKSPALPGLFSKNSLRAVDIDGNGVYEIAYGTSAGMNVTR